MLGRARKTVFALVPDRVRVGDIVLTSRMAFWPFFIRCFGRSDFSHVSICTRPHMLLEAVPSGVIRQSVFETHAYKRKWLRVLRPRRALSQNEFGLKVEHYAEQQYEYQYSTIGAMATLAPRWNFDDPGAVFCSRLVAEAYAQYGLELFSGRNVRKIKPGEFFESPALEEVTQECVQELDAAEDSDHIGIIRATSKKKDAEKQMKIIRRALKRIRKQLRSRLPPTIYTLPQLRYWLSLNSTAAQEADQEIMQTLKEQGYVKEMDRWLASIEAQTTQLDEATVVVMQQPITTSAEVGLAIRLLSSSFALSETMLNGRLRTKEEHDAMSQRAPLATLVYFRDLYRREYECFQRSHTAHRRFLDAVKSLSVQGDQA